MSFNPEHEREIRQRLAGQGYTVIEVRRLPDEAESEGAYFAVAEDPARTGEHVRVQGQYPDILQDIANLPAAGTSGR